MHGNKIKYLFLLQNWMQYVNFGNKKKSMPEISRFYGIIIAMFAKDHNPLHIHAKYIDYQVTITIERGIVAGEIPITILRKITMWINTHKLELLENWELLQNGEEAKKIEPLI